MPTVYSMVKQVLAESKEKLASQPSASVNGRTTGAPSKEKTAAKAADATSNDRPAAEKVAAALDYVADNLGLLVDDRSPQEKLAEYAAISEAMAKRAEEEGKGPHQTQEAPGSFQPPMNPSLAGEQPGAGGNQMQNYEPKDGPPVLEPGESGQAPASVQPPKGTEPGEAAYPGDDAANALETNADSAPGGSGEAPEKIARARAIKLAGLVARGEVTEKVAAAIIARDKIKIAQVKAKTAAAKPKVAPKGKVPPAKPMAKKAAALQAKMAQSGLPVKTARALINKLAEDAINPAHISAGTTPILQTAEGANPAQMQGTPAGEGVPDTKGSDQGREGISSITAAINATKNELKGQRTRAEMKDYLSTPALDRSGDSVLQQSLENASSAGVKIAATKEMLQKWASSSPERRERLQSAIEKVKKANEMMGADPAAAAGAPPPLPMGGDMGAGAPPPMAPPMTAAMPGMGGAPKEAMGEPGVEPVSDAALAAAAQGVNPEELQRAESILQEQMGMAGGMGEMGGEMPPEAMMGGEEGALPPPAEELPPPAEGEAPPAAEEAPPPPKA